MIGFFDSGLGGLTVMKSVVELLPRYDYCYLGDTARVPYGNRSQEIVYEYTKEAVVYLFEQGCVIIIIACSTATALALRKIQQEYLPRNYPDRRVLGVIRPSAEEIAEGPSRVVGILATEGVVRSGACSVEIAALNPSVKVVHQACPLLVPIIEAGEEEWEGTDLIIGKYLEMLFAQANDIDTILLACTHYPLLYEKIKKAVPEGVSVLAQGPFVARRLQTYLSRHPELERRIGRTSRRIFLTTDASDRFDLLARRFYGETVHSRKVVL